MRTKGEDYRQHRIHWSVVHVPESDCIKAKGSVSWIDFSGVFHLHPLPEISGQRQAAAEKELIKHARSWIDNRLKP